MTCMQLRSFNNHGILAFQGFLERVKSSGVINEEDRLRLLQDAACTVPADDGIDMDASVSFKNRFAAGKYLYDKLGKRAIDMRGMRDMGLWAWLALFFVHQLFPEGKDGRRIVRKQRTLYIPDFSDFQRYYRHLLYGPFHIYREHREMPGIAMAVLCTPVNAPGEAVEELASRQHLIANSAVMKAATRLYVGADQKHKRGVARKNRGGVRRFAAVLMQFDLTYDLYQIDAADLIELLPPEFDEFKP